MKVLVISHNPMSVRTSIGKTLVSLFSSFEKDELCQLYINAGRPERDMCSSCYRITEKSVLKGIFTRRVYGGVVTGEDTPVVQNAPVSKKSSANRNKPYVDLLRDTMWALSPWYNKKVRRWVKEQQPTCIFVAIGSNKFLYNMALKISREFSLPLYTYVCDDFYTMKPPKELLGGLWSRLLRRKTRQLLGASSGIVSICSEMSEVYQKEFGVPATTVMTGSNYALVAEPRVSDSVDTFRYFGKVSLNRYKSLSAIGKVLDLINEEQGKNCILDIYCGAVSPQEERVLTQSKSIKLNDFISGQEFEDTFFSSQVLVHIESFDEESVDRVRHSVSTKIADSLSCGIPLLAYGPGEVASMGHLLRNKCAFVATDEACLENVIRGLLKEKDLREEVARQALKTAREYHDPQKASERIREFMI